MGLFDWIGESIGNAFSALAEFIADGFGGILKFMGGKFKDIGKDSLSGIVSDLADGESTAQDDLGAIADAVEAPFTEGWDHTMREYDKKHSELSPENANTEVMDLWWTVKGELITSALIATIVEALSFGQVEGTQEIMKVADVTRSLSAFSSKVSMMKLDAQYLTSFQRYVNKKYPNKIPGPTDLIRMQLREVFHPDYRPELLLPPPSEKFNTAMKEQGFNKYWSDSYWAAHWVLPSMGDLDEMLHRRKITPEEWEIMVRRNDYLPSWIPNRKKIIYKPYTRVDVRRMWDLRSLSEQEVYDNYQDLGYDELHAKKMTTWTKLYVIAVELRARYSKGWITAADVKSEVIAAGMAPARAEIWVQKIIRAESETRTAVERDLTKAEITKGVKKGFISVSEGIELLIDMGYDEAEAEYIIIINVESAAGSPETYSEFKNITNKRRKSLGLSVTELPEGIKELEDQIREFEDLRKEGVEFGEEKKFFTGIDKILDPLKERYQTLRASNSGSDKTTDAPTSKKK